MLIQIHEFKSFLIQQTSSSSRGPCSLTNERVDIATQIGAAKAYTAEFNHKNAHSAALEENANPQVFVPSGGARHRPAKNKMGIEGTLAKKKKQKKSSVNKNIHIGLTCQLKEAECVLVEKDLQSDCSPPCSQELPQENFPEVVLMAALGVRKCYGCKGPILKQNCLLPKRFGFHMQALLIWKSKGQTEWQRCYGNVYFHLTISCVQLHNCKITIEDVTMAADTFTLLT